MFKANHYSLAELNAFRFSHSARSYTECTTRAELLEYAHDMASPVADESPIVFGEGSNTILTSNIDRPVLRYTGNGLSFEKLTDKDVLVKVEAGKNWHELVLEVTERDLQGIENLSLIPGTCGAAPVQNIGAYGVELSDCLLYVDALHWETRTILRLTGNQCQFTYRDSLFKQKPSEYIITDIALKLSTKNTSVTTYDSLANMLADRQIKNPSPREISNLVCEIRRSKLPDPKIQPNAGSFFKNPIVTTEKYTQMRQDFPEIPSYHVDENRKKLAAGWLIDTAGLKGHRHKSGNVAVHDKQALVLVNLGGGTASELLELAQYVKNTVFELFHIELEREPVLR